LKAEPTIFSWQFREIQCMNGTLPQVNLYFNRLFFSFLLLIIIFIDYHLKKKLNLLGKIVNSLTFPDMNIYSVEYSNDGMNYALSLKDHSVITK